MKTVSVQGIKEFLAACDIMGEENVINILKNINYSVKDFIIEITCHQFQQKKNDLKNNDYQLTDFKRVTIYLLYAHTTIRKEDLCLLINRTKLTVYKYIREIRELNERIPQDKILMDKINILEQKIKHFKTLKNGEKE